MHPQDNGSLWKCSVWFQLNEILSESSKTTSEEITISSLEEGDFGSYACTAYFDGWARFEASPGVPLTQLSENYPSAISKKLLTIELLESSCVIFSVLTKLLHEICTLDYQSSSISTGVLSVSESQSLSAGQTTTLSCSVSQPADLPGTAVLAWNKDGSPLSGGLLQTLSLGGFFRGFTEIVRALELMLYDGSYYSSCFKIWCILIT